MLQPKSIILSLLLFISVLPTRASGFAAKFSDNDTLSISPTADESLLITMVNEMRRQNFLQPIPYSAELCKVARVHIADLIKYKPQDRGCSLHSWSGGGKWTACCNTKEIFGIECMKSKPREITGYKGDGYELIYWGEDKATPDEAAALWKQVDASSEMILSQGKWKGYDWKALGVGIQDGYAILWLGDSISTASNPKLNTGKPVVSKPVSKPAPAVKTTVTEKEIVNPKPETKMAVTKTKEAGPKEIKPAALPVNTKHAKGQAGKFYVIAGSFKTLDAANAELKNIQAKGYPSAFIVDADMLFRIAVAVYDIKDKADVRKNELSSVFPGVWVYKK